MSPLQDLPLIAIVGPSPPLPTVPWPQPYNPLGNALLSTLVAALPVVLLLGALASHRVKAHWAALLGLGSAMVIAVAVSDMPTASALGAAGLGAAYGLFPIGWILVNVLFLYRLAVDHGAFDALREHIADVTADRRMQLVLVAFSLGAFFEGAAGFGTPVAITSALLVGLGFKPLESAVLSLLANTAPVAFGALGTPIIALGGVTGLDVHELSAMVGRLLPPFSVIVPFWLVAAHCGIRRTFAVWPALLVAGGAFAVPQYLVATYHGPWLVDIIAAICSMGALGLFLKVWQPKDLEAHADAAAAAFAAEHHQTRREPVIDVMKAWLPWLILALFVFAWGVPTVKNGLNALSAPALQVPGLHNLVERTPPVVAVAKPEAATFTLNWLSATGTAILLSGLVAGLAMRAGRRSIMGAYADALNRARIPLLTIAAMFGIGFVMRYSGLDAILGLAFAQTGRAYPYFGTMLGWLGVALTGSDTSSNVLFGSLQVLTATQVGVSTVLMAAANSAGGVMGKMIDAQSIVVAGAATGFVGYEGLILRRIFWHSIVLASLVGLWVMILA
ncbi:MAG: lactate permease [Gemmatimonas sp.]|nr:lactate permease [Gemmatimonas sp.]